ncbi:MAG: hypothetical protein HGA23_00695 [Bacteroidales bacterium]|nr:hypothetical protein [Bacteroidales bacterium]
MKKIISIILICSSITTFSQIDRDQLSLDISKADAANMEQLKQFVWKRASVAKVDGVVKLNTLSEFSFDETGKLIAKNIDAESTVKQKPGIRGAIQQNAAEDNLDYVQKALQLSLDYTFMSKGELLDFFGKAEISEKDGIIEATAKDVKVKGDVVTMRVESSTRLFLYKKFTSLLGTDPVSGEINYGKFSSGVSHGTTSVLNLPAKKAVINSENKDYTIRVQ